MGQDREPIDDASNPKNGWPIIPHETLGADCCGCLIVQVRGDKADIICNQCAALIRTVSVEDLEGVLTEMARTDTIGSVRCPHCGALNTFPDFSTIEAFICCECGEGVAQGPSVQ
jgi:hypothetical protein